jgi:hydroxymethylpyrimidine/phosphomethylpyrimidine kinase
MYAMSAITAQTAQNTTGVYGVMNAEPDFVAKQLDCIFTDIRPDAVKIGMVSESGIIAAVADKLKHYGAENIVVDPVMVATSGGKLLDEEAVGALLEGLLPLGTVVTPNIPEAEVISGFPIRDRGDMLRAAEAIASRIRGAVLIKGGHLAGEAADLLLWKGIERWLTAPRVYTRNTHGTGCTLSSAIACNLASGLPLPEAVSRAKDYLRGALGAGPDLGQGRGPLMHNYCLRTQ